MITHITECHYPRRHANAAANMQKQQPQTQQTHQIGGSVVVTVVGGAVVRVLSVAQWFVNLLL